MLAAGRRLSQARRARGLALAAGRAPGSRVPAPRCAGLPRTGAARERDSSAPLPPFNLRAAPAQAVRPSFPPVINRRAESDQARRVETRSGSMRSTPSAYPARTAEPGRRSNAGASQTRHLRRRSHHHHHSHAPAQARDLHRPAKHPPARHGGARQGTTRGCLFVAFFTLPAEPARRARRARGPYLWL